MSGCHTMSYNVIQNQPPGETAAQQSKKHSSPCGRWEAKIVTGSCHCFELSFRLQGAERPSSLTPEFDGSMQRSPCRDVPGLSSQTLIWDV